jgi:hypothetical protein
MSQYGEYVVKEGAEIAFKVIALPLVNCSSKTGVENTLAALPLTVL